MKNSVYVLLIVTALIFFATACEQIEKNQSHQQVSNASIHTGKKLAIKYCGSCHIQPDPSLLDTKSWENGVLPEMGPRLGIFSYNGKTYPSFRNDMFVDKNYYPASPVISKEDWQHLIDYYSATSPDSLVPVGKPAEIMLNDNLFEVIKPAFNYNMPSASYISIKPGHNILMCDAFKKKLFVFNDRLQLTDSVNTRGAVTDVMDDADKFIFCITGILHPNNGKFGSVQAASKTKVTTYTTLAKDLMRPVQLIRADLDKDGKDDYVVCEFGNLTGALSWLQAKDSGYERHVIHGAPGAIRACVDDYNHDGLPDIWALFAQGDESIYLFTNKGNGLFEAKQVMRFLPAYGSSYFELDDFNKDGYADIVYTCGDNADYSPVLKPYHGVYIYLNDGKNHFKQQYFYPLNGCYKAIAKDFDNDGDLDIATISFFADYKNHPEEGFVYLKNNGNLPAGKAGFNFSPFTFEAAKYGRWLTMDAGDFDGDGKTDIALGNFSLMDPVFKAGIDWKQQAPFILLKNIQ